MKKIVGLALALVLLLAACGTNTPPDGGNGPPGASQQEQDDTPDASGQEEAHGEPDISGQEEAPPGEPVTSEAEKVIYDGYEMEEVFTIYVNGSEEWTPYPGKSDVFFAVFDEEIVSISDDGTTVRFTGEQVGETMLGARVGEVDLFALVRVRAMDGGEINYVYAPPEDHYYIVFEHHTDGQVTTEEVVARIGRQYTWSYDTSYGFYFADFNSMNAYNRLPDGPWVLDDYEGLRPDAETNHNGDPLPLSAMEEFFMETFYALGGDVSRLSEYYIGNETLYPAPYESTGIDCWVFDIRGFNGNYLKFWIDPSNGCCLKYEDTEDGESTVVTEYNLNYAAWDNAP